MKKSLTKYILLQPPSSEHTSIPAPTSTPEPTPTSEPTVVSVTKQKVIYLTFDDGPGIYTKPLLKLLDKYNVKATFFVCGTGYAYLIEDIYNAGHTGYYFSNTQAPDLPFYGSRAAVPTKSALSIKGL